MSALITCASGATAHKLKKQLTGVDVILGDHAEVPDLMIRTGQIIKLPNPAGAAYQHEMLALCLDKNIDTIYALNTEEHLLLAESRQLFAEYGITLKDTGNDI